MGWLELFKFPERNYVCRKNRGWSHRQASFDVQTLRTQCPWRELQLPFFVYLKKTFYLNWKFIIVIWIFFTGSKCRKKAKKLHSRYLANPMAEYMHFSHHKDGELDSAYKEYKTMHYKKYTSPVEHEQRKHIFKHNLRWYLFWQVYENSFLLKSKLEQIVLKKVNSRLDSTWKYGWGLKCPSTKEGLCFVGSVSGEWGWSNIPRLLVLFHSCLRHSA